MMRLLETGMNTFFCMYQTKITLPSPLCSVPRLSKTQEHYSICCIMLWKAKACNHYAIFLKLVFCVYKFLCSLCKFFFPWFTSVARCADHRLRSITFSDLHIWTVFAWSWNVDCESICLSEIHWNYALLSTSTTPSFRCC